MHSPSERIVINVRGSRFETLKKTLNRYPQSLLGNENSRSKLYDAESDEIYLDRDVDIFNYILFYYQSNGILCRPEWTSEKEFNEEILFFKLRKTTSNIEEEEKKKELIRKNEIQIVKQGYKLPIWKALQYPESSKFAAYIAKFNLILIILSTVVYCLETVESISKECDSVFFVIESTCVSWYTTEYLLRIICAPNFKKFAFSALGIIDILTILPFFISLIGNKSSLFGINSLAAFKVVRLVRVIRVLKLSRYNKGLRILAKAIVWSNSQVKSLILCIMILIIVSSSCMYYAEGFDSKNSEFQSIPHSFWFAVITMTSVGYGDMVPITVFGKISASFCLIGGIILLLSLPVPVLISNFIHFYKESIQDPNETIFSKQK